MLRPLLGALLAASMLLPALGCARQPDGTPAAVTVVVGGEPFALEVAADEASRTRGLMERPEIAPGTGMLFAFPAPDVLQFWMGHCLSDIDVIFLDARGRVTAMHRMKAAPPQRADESDAAYRARLPTYSSFLPAQFAIELPPGSLDRLGIRVEQRIELDLDRLKSLARAADLD